jgi:hypothetical protein
MPLYLTISRGPRADRTQPIMAISDQALIQRVLRMIAEIDADELRPALAIDPDLPPDTAEFRDPDGKVLGRIINLG